MRRFFSNKFVKLFLTILKVLFVCIIVFYILFIMAQRFSNNGSIFGYRLFTVATGSMQGVYEINDIILVKDYDTSDLVVGDDVAYLGNRGDVDGKLVTHRIIKIEDSEKGGKLYTTKGVNSSYEDPSITDSQILGKVVGVVPIVTTLNHILKSNLGFFLCVFLPLVIIIFTEILFTITDIKIENNKLRKISK
jgi:signal peptidase I